MKRIAVLTSGGDAPGMNAAIRAVVRTGVDRNFEVFGVHHGFAGLIEGDLVPMGSRDVSEILQRGGTILGSARCPEFKTEEGRKKALAQLGRLEIGGLIAIGGNGTQTGSEALMRMGFPVVGVASTVDNDLVGSDVTIGVDTALNIALEAVDRLKVTASSHHRAFLVEVMGRKCGYPALMVGVTGGAEAIVIPEFEIDPESVAQELFTAYKKGKAHALIVVAEGARYNAEGLMNYFKEHKERLAFDLRVTILGHVQRGGSPTYADRMLATRLGSAAVEQLESGHSGVLMGMIDGKIAATPLDKVVTGTKPLDQGLLKLAKVMAI